MLQTCAKSALLRLPPFTNVLAELSSQNPTARRFNQECFGGEEHPMLLFYRGKRASAMMLMTAPYSNTDKSQRIAI
jgi:hypothetical protein